MLCYYIFYVFINSLFFIGRVRSNDESLSAIKDQFRHNCQHIAVVCCNDRLPETLVMMKSALIFGSQIHFHIFTENNLQETFKKQFQSWTTQTFLYTIYPIQYPNEVDEKEWKNIFRVCSTQRLFIPYIINPNETDAVIYVDTDVLFLTSPENVWHHFTQMNDFHISALSPEHENPNAGWYNRFARHPYFKPLGVNSGVMLMNFTRMRDLNWKEKMIEYYEKYKLDITFGDQDLINIFFSEFPEKLYIYPCEWNYRTDHCMYSSNCNSAENGIKLLHGSRSAFHEGKYISFQVVYKAFSEFVFGDSTIENLIIKIHRDMELLEANECNIIGQFVIESLNTFLAKSSDIACETEDCQSKRIESLEKSRYNKESNINEIDWVMRDKSTIHIALVACGDRQKESVVSMKSAVIFTDKPVFFHIFAEKQLQELFLNDISSWPLKVRDRVRLSMYNIEYPVDVDSESWKNLFKLCATQRIFIPYMISPTITNKVIYIDTDVIFLRPVEDVWKFFDLFNETQLAALSPEHESESTSWYKRFARHPYYGKLGVNTGVMLMDLEKMRNSNWKNRMIDYFNVYQINTTWGDQDLINIYFHFTPEQLYIYDCSWNYRPDHCMYWNDCKIAEENGVSILHGSRRYFHLRDKQPIFCEVYNAFEKYQFETDMDELLLEPLIERVQKEDIQITQCGHFAHIFYKQIGDYIHHLHQQGKFY